MKREWGREAQERLYQDNINLLRKISWSFHHTTGIDYEEIFDEARVLFFQNLKDYNPSRGAITTYIYHSVRNSLISWIKKQKKTPEPMEVEMIEIPTYDNRSQSQINIFETVESMSDEARAVCKMLLEAPEDFIAQAPKITRGNLQQYLHDKGWSFPKIRRTFKEIREALR